MNTLKERIQTAIETYTALAAMRASKRRQEADAAEKKAIAAAFNDRYTYRNVYVKGAPMLGGTFYGMPHESGYAWMCPECNKIHHPMQDSVWSGLQYPACCSNLEGHRLHEGIRTS